MLSANSQAKMYFVFLCYNYVCVVCSILTCFTFAVLLPCFAFVGFIDWFVSLLLFLKLEFGLELICFGRFAHSVSMCFFFGGLFCFCL